VAESFPGNCTRHDGVLTGVNRHPGNGGGGLGRWSGSICVCGGATTNDLRGCTGALSSRSCTQRHIISMYSGAQRHIISMYSGMKKHTITFFHIICKIFVSPLVASTYCGTLQLGPQ
jgi:hypothetical protein